MFGEEFQKSERVELLISDELTENQRRVLKVPQLCKRGWVSCNMIFLDKNTVINLYRQLYYTLMLWQENISLLGTNQDLIKCGDVIVWLVFVFRVERQKDERRWTLVFPDLKQAGTGHWSLEPEPSVSQHHLVSSLREDWGEAWFFSTRVFRWSLSWRNLVFVKILDFRQSRIFRHHTCR